MKRFFGDDWRGVFILVLLIFGLSGNAEAKPATFIDANDLLLVWVGNGAAAGQQSAAAPGQLAWMDASGAVQPVLEVPPQTSRVMPCGDEALSPNGELFAFYMGLDVGGLYMQRGMDAPQLYDDINALTCLGNGTFQFAPDSSRFAYIAYEQGAATDEFADGFLHLVNAGSLVEEKLVENVTAFDLHAGGAAWVNFFTNDRGDADEAAVVWWDGTSDREIATLLPDNDTCRFTSADVATWDNGATLWLLMGHRCRSGDTNPGWQLYRVDSAARSATLIARDSQPGVFASFARTNNLFFSTDGGTAFFTVPDGVTANTVALVAVNLTDFSLSVPIDRQAVMPTFSGAANAYPRFSPDGRWLAVVITSPNNDNFVAAYDLSAPGSAPITVNAGSRGDTISDMRFLPDSSRLLFTAGGNSSANNSIYTLDLLGGSESRVRRGRFAPGMVLSPDGAEIAVPDWRAPEDPQKPAFQTLTIVNVVSGDQLTLFTGADIVDGRVTNQRFAQPLLWRRAPLQTGA